MHRANRIVSSFAILGLVGAFMLSATAASAAEGGADGGPVGALDVAVATGAKVHVAGWAADPTTPQRVVTVDLYLDGDYTATTTSRIARPDVTAAYPAYTKTAGFDTTIGVSGGSHELCAFAIDQDTLNTRLGCKTITINTPNLPPVGVLDVLAVNGAKVHVAGWAADPTTPQRSVAVDLYIDGDYAATTTTAIARPDVTAAYPAYTNTTGFDTTIGVSGGSHELCVFAIDQDTVNTRLGCKTITIDTPSLPPVGVLDAVAVNGANVHVAGWAADPTTPLRAVTVDLYIDGKYNASTTTALARPDVTAAYPSYTNATGFDTTISVASGTHQLCVFAIDQTTLNTRLGCKTITI
jgi:phage tail tube protein FII